MMRPNAINPTKPSSLITTINLGFQAINRRVWVILVPLVLDLFFWLGPRISPQPWANRWLQTQPEVAQQMQTLVDQQRALGVPFDLRTYGNIASTIRSLITPRWTVSSPLATEPWHVGSFVALVLSLVIINVIGLLLTALYLLLLSDAIRAVPSTSNWPWRAMNAFIRFLGVLVGWSLMAIVAFVPFLIIGALVTLVVQGLGLAIVFLGVAVVVWMAFTAYFAFDAVVISHANPARALLSSVVVVRRWFWSTLGLLIMSSFIFNGLRIVWERLASLGWIGVLVGMIGSAYIGSGLAAAHLVFYRERVQERTSQA